MSDVEGEREVRRLTVCCCSGDRNTKDTVIRGRAEFSGWDLGKENFREIVRGGACKEIKTQQEQFVHKTMRRFGIGQLNVRL